MEKAQAEKLIMEPRKARETAFGDNPEFDLVQDRIVDHTRWSVRHEVVVRRISDQKLFISYYSRGATECQDESPYEYSDPEFVEAKAVEKTVIEYRAI